MLTSFYGLELSNDHKDRLLDGLVHIDGTTSFRDGSFLPEIPSLVFCIHLLKTASNAEHVLEAVANLSMVYLMSIG